ncbi:2-nitropropane dioxygenase-like enzyme [Dioszegia hungarica]|uniref:2-nitropropane dioxygenase-like enzyme n=1 Tax=Dioszegia hungarica TaxID=4972 RepID=A0AA38HCS5_9TREE|nr:2-nitropropane dioxygenase-like enzyme [Dioszegia hungarica]KAI9637612.1 2-nitropropane dioxygenase-like enzyme [Dioszegia hungarica]
MFGPAFPSSPLFRLGVRYPIIQAPMAGTSTPALAAAVSNAGGLGSLGMGASTPAAARKAIEETKRLTDKPFNVNLFVHEKGVANATNEAEWLSFLRPVFAEYGAQPPEGVQEIYKTFKEDEEMLEVLLDTKPAVVSFHFGLPAEAIIRRLRENGAVLLGSATNLEEARRIEASGLDMIIAQGAEAGGHRGMFDPTIPDDELSTFALTTLLLKSSKLPIIPAGGIMDGAGILGYLTLGCPFVQMGTAFILTPESGADAGFRAALKGPGAEHTRLTPLISGRPARCLQNKWTDLATKLEGRVQPAYPMAYDAGKALHAAAKAKGEEGYGAHWAGQGAPAAREMGAGEMVRLLVQEIEEARDRIASNRSNL